MTPVRRKAKRRHGRAHSREAPPQAPSPRFQIRLQCASVCLSVTNQSCFGGLSVGMVRSSKLLIRKHEKDPTEAELYNGRMGGGAMKDKKIGNELDANE